MVDEIRRPTEKRRPGVGAVVAFSVGAVLVLILAGTFAASRNGAMMGAGARARASATQWTQQHPQMWAWMQSHWDEMTLMHDHWGDTAWMQAHLPDWGWMSDHWTDMGWMHQHWQGMSWMYSGMHPGGMMAGPSG